MSCLLRLTSVTPFLLLVRVLRILRFLDFYLRGFLRRRNPFLDEGIPVVTVGALPQELGAAVSAPHADVGIEIEDRVARELAVAFDERGWMAKLDESAPDRLVDAERVRILNERGEEQLERVVRLTAGRQMS